MNDIQLFAKSEKELETLIQAVRIYNYYIGMEFGIEKYVMLIMKSRKRQITEEIELLNQGKIKSEKRRLTDAWKYCKWTPSNKKRKVTNTWKYLNRTL